MKTQSLLNASVLSLTVLFAGCATQQYNPQQCVGWTERALYIPEILELFRIQDSHFTDKNCNFGQALGMLPFTEMTEKGNLNSAYFTLWHRQYTKLLAEKRALEMTGLASNQGRINELHRMIETSDYWTKQTSGGVTSAQLLVMFANKTLNPNDVVLKGNDGASRWQYAPQQPRSFCTGTGIKRVCNVPIPANTNEPAP